MLAQQRQLMYTCFIGCKKQVALTTNIVTEFKMLDKDSSGVVQ